ncbi:MAG TPA: tetratricopeptide repeat protein [Rhizomicrobium sp.]|nr:tetratricopeptide repeat protein [Rhizomicrobium sp.]
MVSQKFRALAVGLLLTTAGAAVGTIATTTVAEAAARPQVGKLLQQAIDLAKSGSTGAANAKVAQAEAVGGLTPGDQAAIAQVKSFIAAKSGTGAVGAKGKFANDYNAGRYAQVVGPDADELRKAGQFDANSQLVVAQAYYLMGNYSQAIRMLSGLSGDTAQSLLMSAAAKSGDVEAEQRAAERLILNGQPKYWTYMLAGADATRGLTDHETLDIARLRLLTGNMRGAEDYQLAAELSIQFGLPTEASAITQKGVDAKVLTDARSQRLVGLAQASAAKDAANLANLTKTANAAKNGDLLVKLGENLTGMGKAQDAITTIQAGIKKGVTNANDAQMRLGQAYLAAGQKDAAVRAFNSVKGDPKAEMVAHIWSLYTRTGGTMQTAASTDAGKKHK